MAGLITSDCGTLLTVATARSLMDGGGAGLLPGV